MIWGVRGATTVAENQPEAIRQAVVQLVESLLQNNGIADGDILSVFFTMTPDLDAMNPATAIRHARAGWQHVPMLCSQEPVVQNMLPRCIRILIQGCSDRPAPPVPVYSGEAGKLRPDLSSH